MKFDGRTQTPTIQKITQLQLRISNPSIGKQKKSEEDFRKRLQRKLEEIEKRMPMPKEPLEDTDMESVRTTPPVDTPEVSSPFTQVRSHWAFRDDVTFITGVLGNVSMESVRNTSPVDTPEVSSPFTEVRAHWALRDDVTFIMGALNSVSFT
jgi:hypothetical protein